jgi:hypothetical protein
MVPLTPSKRARIIERYLASQDLGHPLTMAQVGEHFDVPSSTVSDTLKRWREHGTAYALDRTGRPPKLNNRDERRLIRDIVKYPRRKWVDFAKDYKVSKHTIRRVAASYGYHKRVARCKPFITLAAKKKRLLWALVNPWTHWRRVIFTDETSIELGEQMGSQWTIRRPGEVYEPQHLQTTFHSNRKSLMVWGAIAHGTKWPLYRLPLAGSKVVAGKRIRAEGLGGEKYAEWIIRGQLAPKVEELQAKDAPGEVLVAEDGAPAHTSKVAKAARKETGIKSITHPPSSPDLNPIEGFWNILKWRVGQLRPKATTLDELWKQIQQVWAEIDIEEVNKAIDTMTQRRRDVKKVKGWHTCW